MKEKVKVSCLECGTTNNYPVDKTEKKVVCGRCKNVLPVPGQVLEPPANQVVNLVQNSRLALLIDFYSPTCVPCHMMHAVVENLAKRRAGEVMVVRINVDDKRELASAFNIQAVPTFIVLKQGFEVARTSGAINETDFSLWVASKT
ncbi:MAG: thioredoxin domain-containing protein [Candidatus Aminicenantales bacterium]